MKNFWNFLAAAASVIAVVIGTLAIVDKFLNRNRLEDDYLECDVCEENAE